MKDVNLALRWFFGVGFSLLGFAAIFSSTLGGLCLLGIAAVLLPPVEALFFSKTNLQFPSKARGPVLIVFLVLFFFVIHSEGESDLEAAATAQAALAATEAKEETERQIKIKEANLAKFRLNRVEILTAAKSALTANDYKSVIAQSEQYVDAGDPDLNRLSEIAKSKIEEANKKEREAVARKTLIEAQFSAWDGSHQGLERVVKASMNDPDSYTHVETRYTDQGDHLLVRTTFRGKNAFGGVVKNSVLAKVNLDGRVLKILEQ